jgi:hypothetical protein
MINERFTYHYDKIVRAIKSIIDDEELTAEEKIRLLGVIL